MTNTARSVLVIGQSKVGVTETVDGDHRFADGPALNVAVGLGRLGVETRLLTRVGNDFDGALIWKHLKDAGVQLAGSSFGDTATAADDRPGVEAAWEVPVSGDLAAPAWVHVETSPSFASPRTASVTDYLGSLPATTATSFSPGVRPPASGERTDALAEFESIARLCDVVKLSDAAARRLYPGLSEEFVVDMVLSLGVDVVALTRGSAGALVSTESHTVQAPAPHLTVADTRRAGPAFMAALIFQLLSLRRLPAGEHLADVARRSVAAASLSCSRPGAPLPTLDELEAETDGWLSVRETGSTAG